MPKNGHEEAISNHNNNNNKNKSTKIRNNMRGQQNIRTKQSQNHQQGDSQNSAQEQETGRNRRKNTNFIKIIRLYRETCQESWAQYKTVSFKDLL